MLHLPIFSQSSKWHQQVKTSIQHTTLWKQFHSETITVTMDKRWWIHVFTLTGAEFNAYIKVTKWSKRKNWNVSWEHTPSATCLSFTSSCFTEVLPPHTTQGGNQTFSIKLLSNIQDPTDRKVDTYVHKEICPASRNEQWRGCTPTALISEAPVFLNPGVCDYLVPLLVSNMTN